ncbi:MAG: YidC/Oxa1 family membrane protein insertase [Actinomycetia bacterium]|nr:YidC/Oxa1 family membrane protein insertase [Actinomycetes bacterium]
MFDLIASILAFFYEIEGVGYGGSIILLTLVIMLALTPLTLTGTRSMMKMQRLQPELKKIQREHKDDRQKMNEEMMAFYKANNINPVGGCLPLLVQMPVFLVLFRVLSGLTNGGENGVFEPKYLDESSQLYQDLNQTDEMPFGPFNLAISANDAIQDSFLTGLPYVLLILFVAATSVYQQRQIQGRNPGAEVNSQQQMIMKFLPLSFAIFSFWFATGLVVYWATSNLYRVGQQAWISRTIYGPVTPGSEGDSSEKGGSGGPKPDADEGGPSKGGSGGNGKGGSGGNGKGGNGKGGNGKGGSGKGGSGKGGKGPDNKSSTKGGPGKRGAGSRALPDKRKAGGRAKGSSAGSAKGGKPSSGRTTAPGSPPLPTRRDRKKK